MIMWEVIKELKEKYGASVIGYKGDKKNSRNRYTGHDQEIWIKKILKQK